MSTGARPKGAGLVWVLGAILFVLHYDFWYWSDGSLVFGFVPIGLAYHAGVSVLASLCWLVAVFLAWPAHLEAWADEGEGPAPGAAVDEAA